jgi:hypothetical protein
MLNFEVEYSTSKVLAVFPNPSVSLLDTLSPKYYPIGTTEISYRNHLQFVLPISHAIPPFSFLPFLRFLKTLGIPATSNSTPRLKKPISPIIIQRRQILIPSRVSAIFTICRRIRVVESTKFNFKEWAKELATSLTCWGLEDVGFQGSACNDCVVEDVGQETTVWG